MAANFDHKSILVLAKQVQEHNVYDLQDSIHLRKIFPTEIWKLIATQEKLLKSTQDSTENLANSSPFFRNLLITQRTNFLFEKVFGIVAPNIWMKQGLTGLLIEDVLRFRGVSPYWNNAVDKLIPEKFQFFGHNSVNQLIYNIGEKFERIARTGNFSPFEVEKCIRHFERTHVPSKKRNPFIWSPKLRCIIGDKNYYRDETNRFVRRKLEATFLLVSKFGQHIQHIGIHVTDFLIAQNISKMCQLLLLLPNLQSLELSSESERHAQQNDFDLFPKLKYLRTLRIQYKIPAILFDQMTKQNNQISTLIFKYGEDQYDFFTSPLPKLKTLVVRCNEFEIITKLRHSQAQWPLKSLEISSDVSADIIFSDIFQVIQDKFAKTLEHLCLTFDQGESSILEQIVWQGTTNCRLVLPKLKTIELTLEYPASLDFLLPMKLNLEEIFVKVRYEFPKINDTKAGSGTIVQFFGYEQVMLRSNIWEIFKVLNKIEVKVGSGVIKTLHTFLRETWIEQNEYV